jgi:hypothetical protein
LQIVARSWAMDGLRGQNVIMWMDMKGATCTKPDINIVDE